MINPAELVAAFGDWYLDHGQSARDLAMLPYFKSTTSERFLTQRFVNSTIWRQSLVTRNGILQPYQCEFTPTGGVEFTPQQVALFKMGIADQLCPDDEVEPNWVGFLASTGRPVREWPVIRWYLTEYVLKAQNEDYETQSVYSGEFVAPTAGTPGAAVETMDGLRKVVDDLVVAGRITELAVSSLPASPTNTDVVDFYTEFAQMIPQRFKMMPMVIGTSLTHYEMFVDGMDEKYNVNYNRVPEGQYAKIKNRDITLIPLPSMETATSFRPIMTPPGNALELVKREDGKNRVNVWADGDLVKMKAKFWRAVAFDIPEMVFVPTQVFS